MGERHRTRQRAGPEASEVQDEPVVEALPTMDEMRAAEQISRLCAWGIQLYPLMQQFSASRQALQGIQSQQASAQATLAALKDDCRHMQAEKTQMDTELTATRKVLRDNLAEEMASEKADARRDIDAEMVKVRLQLDAGMNDLRGQQGLLQVEITEMHGQVKELTGQIEVLRGTRTQLLGEIHEVTDG